MAEHPVLRASRKALRLQLRDSQAFMIAIGDSIETAPSEGSGRAAVNQWLSALPQKNQSEKRFKAAAYAIVDQGFENVLHLTASALDHAEALELCLQSNSGLAMSPNTLIRGLLEAALQICFILDPHLPPLTTMLRAAVFQLASVEGGEQTARLFSAQSAGAEQLRASSEAVDGIHAWLKTSGIERITKSPGARQTQSLRIGADRVNLEFDVTAATKRYLPDSPFIYGVLSGAAHSRGWFIGSIYGINDPDSGTPLPDTYAACVLTALTIADALTKSFGTHFGIDYEPELKATHLRRTMLVRINDPGGDDIALDHRAYHAPHRKSEKAASYTAGFARAMDRR
jgi:hypothetical protein